MIRILLAMVPSMPRRLTRATERRIRKIDKRPGGYLQQQVVRLELSQPTPSFLQIPVES
jgi:hypothetical protein